MKTIVNNTMSDQFVIFDKNGNHMLLSGRFRESLNKAISSAPNGKSRNSLLKIHELLEKQ